jgi:hypothetical protein
MRSLLATALAIALTAGLAGCSTPCQDLGHRLCGCRGTGVSRNTCENTVNDQLSQLKPDQAAEDVCDAYLKTCKAPAGIDFCGWLDGADGKLACGLALPLDP